MKLSKLALIACCGVLALSLIGCEPQTPETPPENNTPTETPATPTDTSKEEENKKEEETSKKEDDKKEEEKKDSEENKKDEEEQKPEVVDNRKDWEKIDYTTAKSSYGTTYTITATTEDGAAIAEAYTVDGKTITLKGNKVGETTEPAVYTIAGYFEGQIINTVKNNEIVLNKAYIVNTNAPAILAQKKTSIKAEADTTNYVISTGTDAKYEKSAAIYGEGIDPKDATTTERKSVEFGGKGTCYVIGTIYHAVRANNVELKGSGKYYFQGGEKGAGVNCKNFTVDLSKTVTAYFISAKNGIKADETIEINSGNYYFGSLKTALKTDTTEDDKAAGKTVKEHYIHLYGDTFTYNSKTVEKLIDTDADKYVTKDTTKINKL